ncbi:acid-sensing ion channel 4-B-like isoform X2 [Amblyomma americanum]
MQAGGPHHVTLGAQREHTIRAEKNSQKASMFRHLSTLLYRSQIPGMKVVFGPQVPVARRACWVVMLAVFAGLTCWDIARTLTEFAERPVAIDISLSETERGQLPLPAITVCNMNQVRRSVLCGNDTDLASRRGADYWKERLCNGRPIENVWMSEELLREADNFTAWVMRTQRRDIELGLRMGHQRDDLYLECSFGSIDCRKEKLLYAVPFGRYGTCYCFNFRHGFSFAPENTGVISNGLRMVLDAEIDEYLPLSTEVGFKVMIHEPGVESDYNRNGIHIPPDFATYLRIGKMTLRRLEPPYPQPCRHDWPPGYQQIQFSQTSYTQVRCGCMDHRVRTFNISGAKLCCARGKECMYADSMECMAKVKRLHALHNLPCSCLLPCYEAVYRKSLTHRAWPEFSSLVTNIGGTMGIYLGLSFVMLFSVVDTVATALARTVTSFSIMTDVRKGQSALDASSANSPAR